MKHRPRLLAFSAIASILLAAVAAGTERTGPGQDQEIRIGLTADRERIVVTGSGRFRVLDAETGQPVWKETYGEALTVGIRGARPTEGRIYRAQVGSFDLKETAEDLAARLQAELNETTVVSWVPDRRVWRIRVGAAGAREGLSALIPRLRSAGYPDAWIAEEPVPQSGESSLVLLDSGYETRLLDSRSLAVEPVTAGSTLSLNGRPYRGRFELLLDVSGGLRAVNIVPVESYLRGVVPAELGPNLYPEIEALKAQSVAARTYVYRNLGQFAAEGFDLCDTPRCQVYRGVSEEHPLSDRAIRETRGEIAVVGGEPINALYTSTCGGHTEDAAGIFPEDAAPYLVGVACAPEERARRARRIVLTGSSALADAPADAAEAAALLLVHGLLPRAALEGRGLAEEIAEREGHERIEAVAAACGVEPPGARGSGTETAASSPPSSGPVSLAAVARRAVDRLRWEPRIDLLVEREDVASWVPEVSTSLTEEQAGAVAYFLREKAWPESEKGRPAPARPATRGELARLLLFIARSCDLIQTAEGIVRGGEGVALRISAKGEPVARTLAPDALLFADHGSGAVPSQRVSVVAGDKIRYHLGADGRIDHLLVLPGRQGLSDDRYSATSSWQVAYSAEDLAKRLNGYIGSGSLLDLVPVRRGVSGRVTELKILGSQGEARIRGFPIRTALGLRENLFAIDKQWDRTGALRRVVFTGRGWGHGVGMCQVGAYGMALRGVSYRSILTHYYSGISIERLN